MLAHTSKYFNVIAPALRRAIRKRYGYELARRAYVGARPIYRQMLADCPPIGSDNPMAKNLYEACVFFSMYRAAEGDKPNGIAIAAVAFGALGLLLPLVIKSELLALVLGLLGLVAGAKARKESQTKLATYGFILSGLAALLSLLNIIF